MTITLIIETHDEAKAENRALEVARRFANGTCDGYLLASVPGAVDAWRALKGER